MAKGQPGTMAIATMCVRGKPAKRPSDNRKRIDLLRRAIEVLAEAQDWPPVAALVLPAGYFRIDAYAGHLSHAKRLRRIAKEGVTKAAIECCGDLAAHSPGVLLIVGIDSLPSKKEQRHDQWCAVCDSAALVTITRKIFPRPYDLTQGLVPAAGDYGAPQRIITLPGGKRAVLCVCYDTFGVAEYSDRPSARSLTISSLLHNGYKVDRRDRAFLPLRHACVEAWQQLLHVHQPELAIAVVHRFKRPGLDGYWQRHGLATASAVLGGSAIGAAHFIQRLPGLSEAPLAASGVPARHIGEGPYRHAWRFHPVDDRPVTLRRRVRAVLRLYVHES